MSTSFNSSINQAGKAAGASTDWTSKVNSVPGVQGAGGTGSAASDFSRWLQRASSGSPAPQSADPASLASAAPQAGMGRQTAPSAAERGQANALQARAAAAQAEASAQAARRQAQQQVTAHKPSEAPKSPAPAKPVAAKSEAQQAKAPAHEKAEQADEAKKPQQESTAEEAGRAGQGEADRSTPQAGNDPAAMLAWLANLTQAAAPQEAGQAQGATPESTADLAMVAMLGQGPQPTDTDTRASLASGAEQKPGAIDIGALQAVEAGAIERRVVGEANGQADFAQVLSTELLGAAGATSKMGQAEAPQVTDTLPTPVTSPQFAEDLAEKVGMWIKATGEDGTMSAELHLNPAEMGPINVKISLDGQTAQVDFAAAAVETRRAIEASLPMLSSALDDVGLRLGGSGVSDQSAAQQQFNQSGQQPGGTPAWMAVRGDGSLGVSGPQEPPAGHPGRVGARSGLDLYA